MVVRENTRVRIYRSNSTVLSANDKNISKVRTEGKRRNSEFVLNQNSKNSNLEVKIAHKRSFSDDLNEMGDVRQFRKEVKSELQNVKEKDSKTSARKRSTRPSSRRNHSKYPKKQNRADVSTLLRKGCDQFQHGEYTQAIKSWKRVLKDYPSNSSTLYNLGLAFEKINKQKKSKICLQLASDLGHSAAKSKLQEIAYAKDYEEAEHYLQKLSSPRTPQENDANSPSQGLSTTPKYVTQLKKFHFQQESVAKSQKSNPVSDWNGHQVIRIKFEDINVFETEDMPHQIDI